MTYLRPRNVLLFLAFLPLAGCAGMRTEPVQATTYVLSVTAPASGQGTVTSSTGGISCPGTCSASLAAGTKVTLTATAGKNYLFSGWSGACSGTNRTVTMNGPESVAASFTAGDGISVAVTGTGTVTSMPEGISCTSTSTTGCTATFPAKTQVTLTEKPGTNFYFGGWGGVCSGTAGCNVVVNAAENVTATFTTGDSVAVTTGGTGVGTVTSSPPGISCTSGSTTGCTASFPPNTPVTLTESATLPNVFSGWMGACTGTAGCSLTLSSATTAVTANFAPPGTIASLQHIILFAQENRSLDHYFGQMEAYWAANGYGTSGQTFDGLPQTGPPKSVPG